MTRSAREYDARESESIDSVDVGTERSVGRERKRGRLQSLVLVGSCFAVPSASYAALLTAEAPNGWNVLIPIAAALGAGTTALILWTVVGRFGEGVAVGTALGAAVGVLAHPVTAVLSLVVAFVAAVLGVLPDPPGDAAVQIDSSFEALMVFAVVAFVWCLMSLGGPLWVTLALGGVTGLILGNVFAAIRASASTAEPDRPLPWNSVRAGSIALLVVSLLSLLGLVAVVNA